MTQQEALEAAKLAKVIGSQLGTIDKLMVDPSRSANQIDMNRFISQVVQPNSQHQQNTQYQQNQPSAYVSEDIVRKLVPDVAPQNQQIQNIEPINAINHSEQPQRKINKSQSISNIPVEDKTFKKIATSLEKISKSYEKYVDYIISKDKSLKIIND
jgi:hypothetical protein